MFTILDCQESNIAAASTEHKKEFPTIKFPKPTDPDPAGCEAGNADAIELGLLLGLLPLFKSDVVLFVFVLAGPALFTAKFANTTFIALNSWPKPVLPSNFDEVHLNPQAVPFFPPEHCLAAA